MHGGAGEAEGGGAGTTSCLGVQMAQRVLCWASLMVYPTRLGACWSGLPWALL